MYKVINEKQLKIAISSDLILFLTDKKYAYVVKKTIMESSLESPSDLYKLIGVDFNG